jgi:lipopolysaccharide assembly outer membrane protein LptD (OstA)
MRKVLLPAIVLLGLGMTGSAQDKTITPKPIQAVTAKTMVSSNGSITLLKGDVSITIPGAVIFADEATIDATTNQVELRGKVHMTLTPGTAPIVK